jgi:5-methyltetrahydropteroyltriglutamate--homocysteine methyltransferase
MRTKLPDDKILIPGVISHATDVVGRERVIPGTDCGPGLRLHPQIAWAKLNALVEGARLASAALYARG